MLKAMGVVAGLFGVTAQTMRNWMEEWYFEIVHNGYRGYDTEKIEERKSEERRKAICEAIRKLSQARLLPENEGRTPGTKSQCPSYCYSSDSK